MDYYIIRLNVICLTGEIIDSGIKTPCYNFKSLNSLSWLVVSTRHYIKEYDWDINSNKGYCTGCLKEEGKEGLYKNKGGTVFETFILMPELQDYSIEDAAEILRNWCIENNIPFKEDLDNYKIVERSYWGYDDFNILRVGV